MLSTLVALVSFASTVSVSRAAFVLQQQLQTGQSSSNSVKTALTATTSTPSSQWWPPSSTTVGSFRSSTGDRKTGIIPGSSREYDLYPHQQEQEQQQQQQQHRWLGTDEIHAGNPSSPHSQQSLSTVSRNLPVDPLAAARLRNAVHQAACDALIYQNRWKFCIAVWDEQLLDWLVGTACPGSFWTPRTYMVLAATTTTTITGGMQQHDHPIWYEWEGTKRVILSLNGSPSESVQKLRSLASRILPRLSNSGRRETDLPVFDTIILTSSQLQNLLNQVSSEIRTNHLTAEQNHLQQQQMDNKKRRKKKRNKQKTKDEPWVIALESNPQSGIVLSLNVLKAAKQLIVVQDTKSWNIDLDCSVEEILPQCLWLETSVESRMLQGEQCISVESFLTNLEETTYVPPQTPEEVPWGDW
ncbi:hypothetical protein IV203_021321 [Nitzschia inconspicua]|uniref:Uncharacterized protein n=1 Tax=Nitzschia inconspicua TaxID=303405 RepID=A0A9K3PE53_9STRA|nr:hypothetical protein IV203_021321 [Nitzschia inconspicua]